MKFFSLLNRKISRLMQRKSIVIMGGNFQKQWFHTGEREEERETNDADVERYFRPSCLSVLNNRFDYAFFDPYYDKKHNQVVLPPSLMNSPEDTILNYFSMLREAVNFTDEKTGGCGTVGMTRIPYPVAYNFFTKEYQKRMPYQKYLRSFEGIGHTSLIKLEKLRRDAKYPNAERYFIEIETIEGSNKGVTYFAYYYGYVYIQKENGSYKIANIDLYGEDFLCAPYHLWQHNAELVVETMYGEWCKLVKKQFPTKQEGYEKQIDFTGTDGSTYRFIFFQLTNDTDVLVKQYKRNVKGEWEEVEIDPEKCIR
ncbi:hypothetical protein BAMA_20490 [Bacillus manliponensis]|uniref:Uncharacterized protein n=2 Tax=Bacillus manliponensis TaxID=574376 RepID=A0A073JXA6_9BACI|nr:hypothetical protein BAMA_20490 [Bacillus manliponensis]